VTDPRVAPQAARFGDVADRYERARPLYPEAALSELAARCGLRPGTAVLDLGAGTGKLTRQLVAVGADVVAVEPAAGMRRRLEAEVPGVPVVDDGQRREVLERLRQFLEAHPETRGRQRLAYTRPCTLHLCQRTG
jgi:cyclopropane fatty-acyl-phospholipid synthase-like methyltransferase